jgi:hypothetical protein
MLARALYCPDCEDGDSPMYRIRSGVREYRAKRGRTAPGREYFYYRCSGRGAARVSCGNLVRMELVDAAVNAIIAGKFNTPVMEHQIVPGNEAQIENRLEEIRFELTQLAAKGLPWAEEDAERAVLRAEYDRVAATPIIEDRVDLLPTSETYLEQWERLAVPERGRWLAENGFKVYATKTGVRVTMGDFYAVAPL